MHKPILNGRVDSLERLSPYTLNHASGNFTNLKQMTLVNSLNANTVKTSKFGENNLLTNGENNDKKEEEINFEIPQRPKKISVEEELQKESILKNLKNNI